MTTSVFINLAVCRTAPDGVGSGRAAREENSA
jgi:hypothetical protein